MMEDLSGLTIKGYELSERIGAGGFGAVYTADQSTIGRRVAVKIILPGFANQPDFIRRFESEARLIARLEHPYIVPLYDYWRDPSGAYLVMRWLQGGSLRDKLLERPFNLPSAARILDQAASALALAHRNGVIHRDIKPSNILLDEEGNAYLSDFGIAQELKRANDGGRDEGLVGTLDYLAPEQALNEAVGPQSDIYSLGVTLYELITGQHPFPGHSSVERLFKHINDPLPEINDLDETVRAGVNDVIRKATAKNPAHRYQDALEMASAFRRSTKLDNEGKAALMVETLTPREQEILALIVEGKTNRQIAQELFVEISTVKWYITQIYRKLGVRNRVQAMVRGRELQLVVPEQNTSAPAGNSTSNNVALPEPINPYKGLKAFEAADSGNFFGREALIDRIISKLDPTQGRPGSQYRFLAIVGPSGSGKSSLVKAGLIPAIWRGDLPGSDRWFVMEMMPGARPLDELEVAMMRVAANQAGRLREQLQRDENGLLRAAGLILPNDDSEIFLVIDQFEEIFTLVEEEAERRLFLDLLHRAVTDSRSRVRVVITLRADFYHRPLQYPQFGELVRRQMETVLPLSASELERVIVGPAERIGIRFEEGLVPTIFEDVHYQPGALPLMQYALTELFDRREEQLLTCSAYEALGGTMGALSGRAESLYRELDADGQEATRQLFLRLTTVERGADGGQMVPVTRRRVTRSELRAAAGDAELMDEIIDIFTAYRLLSLDHDPATRRPTVEAAHEAILVSWARLGTWLEESRDDVRFRRRLAAAAAEWLQAGQDDGFLLRGSRLDLFSVWAVNMDLALTQDEQAFLDASIAARQEREAEEEARLQRELETAQQLANTESQRAEEQTQAAKRLRRQALFLVAALVVAALLAVAAIINGNRATQNAVEAQDNLVLAVTRESEAEGNAHLAETRQAEAIAAREATQLQADLATSRELSLAALANLEADPELTMLLALQALNRSYTKEAAEALHRGLQASRLEMTLSANTEDPLWGVIYSPDGSHLVTVGDDHTVKVWEAASGQSVHTLPFEGIGYLGGTLSFDESGDRIALVAVGDDSQSVILHIWDAGSGELLDQKKLPIHMENWSLVLSPDWKRIAAGHEDGTAELWDVDTAEILHTFSGHDDIIDGLAINADGSRLAVTSHDDQVTIWDIDSALEFAEIQSIISFEAVNDGEIRDAFFSNDSTHLALVLAREGDVVELWNLADTRQPQFTVTGHTNEILDVAFHPDDIIFATGSSDSTAKVWDINSGEELFTLSGHKAFVNALDFSPDGARLVTASSDGTARIWNAQPQPVGQLLSIPGGTNAFDLELSPDEQKIALGSFVGGATIWDAATGTLLHTLPGESDTAIWRVAFSPDGSRIATVGEDGIVRIWDANTGETLLLFTGHTEGVSGVFSGTLDVSYSPDGRHLATAGADGLAKVWDAETGEELLVLAGHTAGLHSLAYSPDGNLIATSSDRSDSTVKVWDTKSGQEVYSLGPNPDRAWGLAFSPDSNLLAAGGTGGYITVWDMRSGEVNINMTGQSSTIGAVTFTPDGRRLITGGGESASIWDLESGTELLNLIPAPSFRVALTKDGRRLYAASGPPVVPGVGVFPVPLEDAVTLAQSRVTRTLSSAECRQYLHMDICPEQ